MKILVLANNDMGLYKFRRELLCDLLEQNDVYISLPNGEFVQSLIDDGCEFIETNIDRRGINPIKDIKLLFQYIRIIHKIKPDKVITYTIKPNVYGGLACRFLKTQYYANITGLGTVFLNDNWLKQLSVFLYKIALKKARTVFFENEANRQVFIDNKIAPVDKTCKLNGAGVDLDRFKFFEYPHNDEEVKFLYIGRIMKEKGIDELLEAMSKLYSSGVNCSLDILGWFEEDYRVCFEEYKKKFPLNYWGNQKDVRPFIEKSHCFVLPSYHEGMANTLLEAGAIGRPLITSNIHGCLEAVENGKTGYLCTVGDADDLYTKMKMFVDLPHEKKKEMGNLSHNHIANIFDKKIVVEKTIMELMK